MTHFACDECGFDNRPLSNADLVDMIEAINVDPATLSDARPSVDVWSPREYARHLREVVEFYGARIELVLAQHRPQFSGADFTVAPEAVDDAPDVATLVARLRSLNDDDWRRVGIGSSDGGERDVRNLASRLAHEGFHHLLDIDKSL